MDFPIYGSAQEFADQYKRAVAKGDTQKSLAALDDLQMMYPLEIYRAIPNHDGAARGELEAVVRQLSRHCDLSGNCLPNTVFSALGLGPDPDFIHLHYTYKNRENSQCRISIVQAKLPLPIQISLDYLEPGQTNWAIGPYCDMASIDKVMRAALHFLKLVIAGTHPPGPGELVGKSYRTATLPDGDCHDGVTG